MRKHYINLTDGLEALPEVQATGEPWAFSRIQSTTIERRDWWSLLMIDLGEDLPMHLALGWECILHDRGTRRPRSKTCYYAVPLLAYILNRRWYGLAPEVAPMQGRRGNAATNAARYFAQVYREVVEGGDAQAGRVRRRLDFFGRFAVGRPARLVGCSRATERDGDKVFYRGLALAHAAPAVDLPEPASEPAA